jgi:hypothetical protein
LEGANDDLLKTNSMNLPMNDHELKLKVNIFDLSGS